MNHLISYAMQFVGKPYIWGGEHPCLGYDCSGLVQEILRSVGLDPPGDQTAQKLFDHFEKNGSLNTYAPGSIAFFGKSVSEITHVAFCIDRYRMIEAGGGGRTCINVDEAIKAGAFVRMRLITSRKDLVAIIKPRYATIGCI